MIRFSNPHLTLVSNGEGTVLARRSGEIMLARFARIEKYQTTFMMPIIFITIRRGSC